MTTRILKMTCPDAIGLLARVTGEIARRGGNLLDVSQYTDISSGWFFARLAFEDPVPEGQTPELISLLNGMRAVWTLRDAKSPLRAVVLVSREAHCLVDLLWRWKSRELNVEIPCVVSNHGACRSLVEREELPFHEWDFSTDKESVFRRLAALFADTGADFVVMARFMQILPPWMCEAYEGRILNIHHSFLPAFKGASPYRRAFERGVKLIGATCHYATAELDAGPIIEQEVARVEHYHEPEDLVRLGRDCERLALARGVRYHAEDRVLVHGRRAIVFRD